ncbi:MAG: hemerythrin domain-containing protein [Burkholderiaceae bacterium]
MSSPSETGLILGREHRDNLALLARVEQAMQRSGGGDHVNDPEAIRLVRSLCEHMTHDLARHFAFEEEELFPRMVAAGEGDIPELLTEEHDAIRAVGGELTPLVGVAAGGTLDAEGWNRLRRLALELVERLLAHVEKEEMSLVPLLDDLLDDETDRALALGYASS